MAGATSPVGKVSSVPGGAVSTGGNSPAAPPGGTQQPKVTALRPPTKPLPVSKKASMPGGLTPGTPPTGYLISFTETVKITGGGPVFEFMPNLYGPWQKQLIYPATPGMAVQSGTAVGMNWWPPCPAPIWPWALVGAPEITRISPGRKGATNQGYSVSWKYTFKAAGPLTGLPRSWPG